MLEFCSHCKELFHYHIIPYCPLCGALPSYWYKEKTTILPTPIVEIEETIIITKKQTLRELNRIHKEDKKIQLTSKKKKKKKWNKTKLLEWSRQVRLRDNYTCQKCGGEGLFAHHIKPKKSYPELAFDLNNGITLCNVCHGIEHDCKFDVNGAFLPR